MARAAAITDKHQFVFVGGLHKSGTSLVASCLREHLLISGFRGTGVPEDEGQHLQTVYPTAGALGGPGRFGFDSAAHLTESSELVSEENRDRLISEWQRYWDLSRTFLLEKSPPNLIRTRFLQALFPSSHFIIVVRDPVPVAYATQKWSGAPTESLIRHWLVCHEVFEQDRSYLARVHVVRYEKLVERPQAILEELFAFLGLSPPISLPVVRPGMNAPYHLRWREYADAETPDVRRLVRKYRKQVARWGYELWPAR